MHNIRSKDNNAIKYVKKLKEKKYRNKEKKFIVEGIRFTMEAIKSDYVINDIFVDEDMLCKPEFKDIVNDMEDKVTVVAHNLFLTMCSTENPQGILAVLEEKDQHSDKIATNDKGTYILVDKVQDPGNLGTIIRTAHAAGCSGVILTKGTVDLYNEKTLRSTMGSIFNINIIQEDEEYSTVKFLKEKGYKVICSSLEDSVDFYTMDLTGKVIITVGNEGNGISSEVYELGDLKVKIPMPGGAESLNVAVATSIMVYEVLRQKTIK